MNIVNRTTHANAVATAQASYMCKQALARQQCTGKEGNKQLQANKTRPAEASKECKVTAAQSIAEGIEEPDHALSSCMHVQLCRLATLKLIRPEGHL